MDNVELLRAATASLDISLVNYEREYLLVIEDLQIDEEQFARWIGNRQAKLYLQQRFGYTESFTSSSDSCVQKPLRLVSWINNKSPL